MQLAETFEPEQQAAEFILPTKHPLNGIKPFLEDLSVEEWLAAAFGGSPRPGIGVDVWHHIAIENRLPVTPAIVDAIKAYDRASKIEFDGVSDRITAGSASRRSGDSF
jgi:hypothetical protein